MVLREFDFDAERDAFTDAQPRDEDGDVPYDMGMRFVPWLVFEADGPRENGFRFCCYCGAALTTPDVAPGEE